MVHDEGSVRTPWFRQAGKNIGFGDLLDPCQKFSKGIPAARDMLRQALSVTRLTRRLLQAIHNLIGVPLGGDLISFMNAFSPMLPLRELQGAQVAPMFSLEFDPPLDRAFLCSAVTVEAESCSKQ
jgi:hypothetical protein